MKTLLYIGFLLISMSSFAQFYKLSVDFHPSFLKKSKLIINSNINGYSIFINGDDFEESSNVPDSLCVVLENFFEQYDFSHKGSIDTIGQEKIVENGDTIIYYQLSMGTDGIDVYGELINKNRFRTFKFWSPDKLSKNHELVQLLFEIMYNSYSNTKTIDYLEQLEQYFDFGLGLRKLNDDPLTYKLYGSISANEVDELYAFFDSLPVDKKVYIDMSNFNGMGTMFDEDFLELSETHRLVTWINCSENAKMTLKRAEIKGNRYK